MRIKEITFIICTILAYGQSVMAQSQIVVCNATNKMPIQYANVYKAEKGEYTLFVRQIGETYHRQKINLSKDIHLVSLAP